MAEKIAPVKTTETSAESLKRIERVLANYANWLATTGEKDLFNLPREKIPAAAERDKLMYNQALFDNAKKDVQGCADLIITLLSKAIEDPDELWIYYHSSGPSCDCPIFKLLPTGSGTEEARETIIRAVLEVMVLIHGRKEAEPDEKIRDRYHDCVACDLPRLLSDIDYFGLPRKLLEDVCKAVPVFLRDSGHIYNILEPVHKEMARRDVTA